MYYKEKGVRDRMIQYTAVKDACVWKNICKAETLVYRSERLEGIYGGSYILFSELCKFLGIEKEKGFDAECYITDIDNSLEEFCAAIRCRVTFYITKVWSTKKELEIE